MSEPIEILENKMVKLHEHLLVNDNINLLTEFINYLKINALFVCATTGVDEREADALRGEIRVLDSFIPTIINMKTSALARLAMDKADEESPPIP
jgi:hypothetical protein